MQSSPSPASPTAPDTLTRPPSGLARGAWDAPPAAIAALGLVLALGAVVALLASLGVLPRRSRPEAQP